MDKPKRDLRVIRTKSAIKLSFIKLICDNSIDKVTIFEICKLARINRITFYNHYHDKYDLFNSILHDLKLTINNRIESKLKEVKNNNATSLFDSLMTSIVAFIDICYENKKVILSVIKNKNNAVLQYLVKDFIEKSLLEIIKKYNLYPLFNVPLEPLLSFYTGGSISLIEHSLSDESMFSKDDLISFICSSIKDRFI